MTQECPFYRVERKTLESKEIRADRQRDVQILKMPWCAHPNHSPVDRFAATKTIGGGSRLKCDGDRAKCPLTSDEFNDI